MGLREAVEKQGIANGVILSGVGSAKAPPSWEIMSLRISTPLFLKACIMNRGLMPPIIHIQDTPFINE